MSKKVSAILLDTRGIQKYVFGCNKLKTNIGASYLVDVIYKDVMNGVLAKLGILEEGLKEWNQVDELQMLDNPGIKCETGYIGGGNMLLFINMGDDTLSMEMAKKVVSTWTEELLVFAPGLRTGAAIGMVELSDLNDPQKYKAFQDELYKQLKKNQNNILPEVDLPYTGLTLECEYSGKTADIKCNIPGAKENDKMLSAEVNAKILACSQANDLLSDEYSTGRNDKGEKYGFVSEIENIGFKDGESYISVIHIDGNNMGVKFSCAKGLAERKNLSVKVAGAVRQGFKDLVEFIEGEYDVVLEYLDKNKLAKEGNVLPIRPIIIGGDDVTFICPGRLGLRYARKFVESVLNQRVLEDEQKQRFEAEANKNRTADEKITLNKGLSCCAGVAIVPAKYPFFRAYELAEQLCSAAKKYSRKDDSSWLEFAVLHGEAYSSLDTLRKNQYTGAKGANGRYRNMHYGPYEIGKADSSRGIDRLFELCEKLRESHRKSRNKLKGLREVLFKDDHGIKVFLENDDKIRALVNEEKEKKGSTADETRLLWIDVDGVETTRYLDAIEIMDFVIPDRKEIGK